MNPETLSRHLAPVLKEFVAQETGALRQEISELRAVIQNIRAPEDGEKGEKGEQGEQGEPGRDGKDADIEAIERRIDERFIALKKEIPAPEKGKDGRDGVSIVEAVQNKAGELVLILSDGASKNVGVIQGRDGQDGKPGENANIEAIRDLVSGMTETKGFDAEALKSLIPEPGKGKDGEKGPQGESAYQIAVKNGFQGSEREWLESLKGESGKDGAPGNDGADGRDGEKGEQGERGVDVENVRLNKDGELVFEMSNDIDYNVGDLRGEKGLDGKDAEPVDYAVIEEKVKALVGEVAKSIPEPKDGRDGKDADMAEIFRRMDEAIAKIPAPKDGKDGKDGRDGADADMDAVFAEIDKAVKAIPPAKDGRGVKTMHVNHDGELRVLYTDDVEKNCGVVVGPEGHAGRDGFGFDDMWLEHDGEREVKFVWQKGDTRRESPIVFPTIIDRGIYKAGETYQIGDGVTWGGSLWIATKETADKPGSEESGWRLAVKKGRDGKDGKPGEKGLKGDTGRPGRDLTQINPETGEKW